MVFIAIALVSAIIVLWAIGYFAYDRGYMDGTAQGINIMAEEYRRTKEKYKNNGGTYECFHCLSRSVVWGADFDFDDYGYEGEGIVHNCTCANCGADIQYIVRFDDEQEDDE